jgi:hypothetical protein
MIVEEKSILTLQCDRSPAVFEETFEAHTPGYARLFARANGWRFHRDGTHSSKEGRETYVGPSSVKRETCPNCKQEIDPETCHCGDPMDGHSGEHSGVPMGCMCGYADSPLDMSPKSESNE